LLLIGNNARLGAAAPEDGTSYGHCANAQDVTLESQLEIAFHHHLTIGKHQATGVWVDAADAQSKRFKTTDEVACRALDSDFTSAPIGSAQLQGRSLCSRAIADQQLG
jgi:hypothetical protein